MEVVITAEGFATAEEFFKTIAARSQNFQRPMLAVADVVMSDFGDQFDTAGRGRWADIKPESRREKVRKGLDPRVMRATNALANSLTHRGAEHQEFRVDELGFALASTLPYARRQLRKRPLTLSYQSRRRVAAILRRWLTKGTV